MHLSVLPPMAFKDMVIGIIAGGDAAIRSSVESAEDSTTQCWKDLQKFNIDTSDILIGIASNFLPYVIQGLGNGSYTWYRNRVHHLQSDAPHHQGM